MTYIAYSVDGTRRLLEVPRSADRELEFQAAITAARDLYHDYLATVWAYDPRTTKALKIFDDHKTWSLRSHKV